eukprot:GILJ01007176.1.p1 GENE.GILJ01007176.1~~GILJ01007176.1.p1  ORF type:complete len:1038 (+),score=252.17 GILJ01007176.1:36-3116(+)
MAEFQVEYAKTGRASCKDSKCKLPIAAGTLRLARVAANPFGDVGDTMLKWYHPRCMFNSFTRARASTAKIESEDDIEGFDELKAKDKDLIRNLISGKEPAASPGAAKATTRRTKRKKADDDEEEDEEDASEDEAPAAKKTKAEPKNTSKFYKEYPRLECVSGHSSKFWQIIVDGKQTLVNYGRIGTSGQSQIKDHISVAAATAFADKQHEQKLSKEYDEADGGPASQSTKPKVKPTFSPLIKKQPVIAQVTHDSDSDSTAKPSAKTTSSSSANNIFKDVSSVSDILKLLELEDQIPVFAKKSISVDAFLALKEDDLKELGLVLGPRKKIINNMSEIRNAWNSKQQVNTQATVEKPKQKPSNTVAKPLDFDGVNDVDDFLKVLGLDSYAHLFEAESIDMDAFLLLSESDLDELGLPAQASQKIASAMADIKNAIKAKPKAVVKPAAVPPPVPDVPSSSTNTNSTVSSTVSSKIDAPQKSSQVSIPPAAVTKPVDSKTASKKKEPKAAPTRPALDDLVMAVSGRMSMHQRAFTPFIETKGGSFSNDVDEDVDIVLSTAKDIGSGSGKISSAKRLRLPIVEEQFIHEAIRLGDWRKVDVDAFLLYKDSKIKFPKPAKRIADDSEEATATEEEDQGDLEAESTDSMVVDSKPTTSADVEMRDAVPDKSESSKSTFVGPIVVPSEVQNRYAAFEELAAIVTVADAIKFIKEDKNKLRSSMTKIKLDTGSSSAVSNNPFRDLSPVAFETFASFAFGLSVDRFRPLQSVDPVPLNRLGLVSRELYQQISSRATDHLWLRHCNGLVTNSFSTRALTMEALSGREVCLYLLRCMPKAVRLSVQGERWVMFPAASFIQRRKTFLAVSQLSSNHKCTLDVTMYRRHPRAVDFMRPSASICNSLKQMCKQLFETAGKRSWEEVFISNEEMMVSVKQLTREQFTESIQKLVQLGVSAVNSMDSDGDDSEWASLTVEQRNELTELQSLVNSEFVPRLFPDAGSVCCGYQLTPSDEAQTCCPVLYIGAKYVVMVCVAQQQN